MAFQLKPKEEKFFALLEKHAELGANAGKNSLRLFCKQN